MLISFSGSFHCVWGVTASQRSFSPNPLPPVNFAFMSSETGFSVIWQVPTLM